MVLRMLTIVPEGKKKSSIKEGPMKDANALKSTEVPYRLPSFMSPTALNNHIFEANGEIYEYMDG